MPHHQFENGKILQFQMETLWNAAKAYAPIDIPLTRFDLDYDGWYNGTAKPTIKSMIDHFKRCLACDMRYPIIICWNGKIMDGRHRLARAVIDEQQDISAIVLRERIVPDRSLEAHEVPAELFSALQETASFKDCDLDGLIP